ncbi:MAG: redoxin domain-containing protein [Acidobacteriaceae bacterium]
MRALAAGLALLLSSGVQSAVDLSGHGVDPLGSTDGGAVVLFFVATDCSVSNRYVPEIQRLQAEFAAEGVRFWFIYPNPEDTSTVVGAHDAQFAIYSSTALDTSQLLVRRAHVVATPEAAVFVPEGGSLREVYHGRIDDRYLSFGRERPHGMHHDLEVAIRAALAHQPVPPPGGDPVGCAIMPLQK